MSEHKISSKIRVSFFPIYGEEIRKFIPMVLMMSFILFSYTILRDTKDVLLVSAAGAESISFIKLFGVAPATIISIIIYAKLSNFVRKDVLFYITIIPFILFFFLFAYIIYPNFALLHADNQTIVQLSLEYPRLKTALHVYGNWSYAAFYIMAELWAILLLPIGFWQLANDIVKFNEAKRFYPMFGLFGNFGTILSGVATQYFTSIRHDVLSGSDPWGLTLKYITTSFVLVSILIMLVYWWINKYIVEKECISMAKPTTNEVIEKPSRSLIENCKHLVSSKELPMIATIVVACGVVMGIIEPLWHHQIKEAFPNQNDYNSFLGMYSMTIGISSIVMMIVGTNILRIFGWKISALITPIVILVTSVPFFGFILCKDGVDISILKYIGLSSIMLSVWLGFAQSVMVKVTKYSLFDPTKEMCYIPLEEEIKVKGKAIIDGGGSRFGKAGGSIIQQVLLAITGGSIIGITPVLGGFVVLVIIAWLFAIRALSKDLTDRLHVAV